MEFGSEEDNFFGKSNLSDSTVGGGENNSINVVPGMEGRFVEKDISLR